MCSAPHSDICQTFLIHKETAAPCESGCPIVVVCHKVSEVMVVDVSENMEMVEVIDVFEIIEVVEVIDVSEMTKIQ